MEIRWTGPALRDMEDIVAWMRQLGSATAASRTAGRIFEEVEALSSMPRRGRVGLVSNTRELVLLPTPYIAVYEVQEELVLVLRIRHGARNWPL